MVANVVTALAVVVLVVGAVAVVTERADWCPDRLTAAMQLLLPWWGLLAIVVGVGAALATTW